LLATARHRRQDRDAITGANRRQRPVELVVHRQAHARQVRRQTRVTRSQEAAQLLGAYGRRRQRQLFFRTAGEITRSREVRYSDCVYGDHGDSDFLTIARAGF
jgi:hypothetical protein